MMADRHHVRPRLVDLAVDHALGILRRGIARPAGEVEVELDRSSGSTSSGARRARQDVAVGIVGMAHADVPEGVEHALVGDDAVGDRELAEGFCH